MQAHSQLVRVTLATGTLFVALVTSGCGSAPAAPTPELRQTSIESQIQTIQNDPKMSPQSKQQAIAALKGR